MEGSILEDFQKIREEHAARFNYDIRAMFEDLKKREADGGVMVASLESKRFSKVSKVAKQG